MPQVGTHDARQDRRHASTHVADVRRSFAEVVVVDRREHIRLLRRRPQDRLVGRRAAGDEGEGRTDDARVAREQRLGLEDRADLLAGSRRGLDRQRFELGRAAIEGVGRVDRARQRPSRARGRFPRADRRPRRAARAARPPAGARSPRPGSRHVRRGWCAPWSAGPDPDRAGQRAPAAASASARNSRADDVAPGSWCPIDRSPRYEARPFVASIGIVAMRSRLGGLGHRRGDVRGIQVGRHRGPPGVGRRHERIEHRLLAGHRLARAAGSRRSRRRARHTITSPGSCLRR